MFHGNFLKIRFIMDDFCDGTQVIRALYHIRCGMFHGNIVELYGCIQWGAYQPHNGSVGPQWGWPRLPGSPSLFPLSSALSRYGSSFDTERRIFCVRTHRSRK